MEELVTQLIQSQGIWAVLFVFLLLYTIKKNDKLDEMQDAREKEYQKLLLELTDKLSIVNSVNDKLDKLCANFEKQNIKKEPMVGILILCRISMGFFVLRISFLIVFFFNRFMYWRVYPKNRPISSSVYP